jgi:hypothetical protein
MKSKVKPTLLYDDQGNKAGVLLKIKEFEKYMEELEDLHDLIAIYKHKIKPGKSIPYEKIREKMFGKDAKK